MEDLENIDKHLKQSLEDYSVQPRITSFDAVLKKLEKRKKRRFLIWFLFPGIAILGGMLSLGSFHLFHPNNYPEQATRTSESTFIPLKTKASSPKKNTLPNKTNTQAISEAIRSHRAPKKETTLVSSANKTKKQKREISVHLPMSTKNKMDSVVPPARVLLKQPALFADADTLSELLPERLEPMQLSLIAEVSDPDPILSGPELVLDVANDSVISIKPKRKMKFLLGLDYTPQGSSYHYAKNRGYDDDGAQAFPELYRKNKKSQAGFDYNHSFGIKAGLLIKEKWELLFGFGYQRYAYKEIPYQLGGTGNTQSLGSGNVGTAALSNANTVTDFHENKFSYFYYSCDASTYFKTKRFMKVKAGAGLQINQLHAVNTLFVAEPNKYSVANKEHAPASKWMCNINVTMGFIQDLGNRAQFHLCPGFFYSPNSMFNHEYVIKQKAFGFNLECLLLFKLGKL